MGHFRRDPHRHPFTLDGIVNRIISVFGGESVYFLGDPNTFQGTVVWTHIWKEFGFATIVYLAAISNIDPTQYESASIDGAKRWQKVIHITLPGMSTIIILLATLSLGSILNAGFEQIFTLYNPESIQPVISSILLSIAWVFNRHSTACQRLSAF
jgi:putative aldouronate transport system permease protein